MDGREPLEHLLGFALATEPLGQQLAHLIDKRLAPRVELLGQFLLELLGQLLLAVFALRLHSRLRRCRVEMPVSELLPVRYALLDHLARRSRFGRRL